MNKIKWYLTGLLLAIAFVMLFIWEWGYIITIIALLILLVLVFNSKGGSILIDMKTLFSTIITTRRKEEFVKNTFIPEPGAKIALGLSGGVDSAVSAFLLKEQGYHVEAFFMRNWDSSINLEFNNILGKDEPCKQEADYEDAKLVAAQLGIKLHRVDFIKEYWDLVFTKFLKEIELGLTPNPDIFCNKFIKFDKFINYVLKEKNFDYVAMGHYARIVEQNNHKYLGEAVDFLKDQTYFLAQIKKETLNKIYFPLGELTKVEVREIALQLKLAVAFKKDSTGICFIGERNFPKFLQNYLEKNPGKIIDEETKEIIGEHDGVLFYTIGQRRGLNLGGFEKPYFVSKKDIKKNILYVSAGEKNEFLFSDNIIAENFNLLVPKDWIEGALEIKVRHSEVKYKAKVISFDGKKLKIKTNLKIRAATPGQEVVLYKKSICLGGGQIV